MILDAIIALFAPLFGALLEVVALVAVPGVNLLAFCLEAVVGIFVSGFSVGRISRKKRKPDSPAAAYCGLFVLVAILGLVAWFTLGPLVTHRTVTLRAVDGHSLPFAELVIHTEKKEISRRTDTAGNISIPRYGVRTLTVKDPRYIEKTWHGTDIEPILVVERTVLGASLDKLADKLLKPAR